LPSTSQDCLPGYAAWVAENRLLAPRAVKQAQAAEQAGDLDTALSAYCELSQEDKKNQSASAKCAELTQRTQEARKKDAERMSAGEQALAQNRFDDAIQNFKAVVGKQYHEQAKHYLSAVIPQAQKQFEAERERLAAEAKAAEAKNDQLFKQGLEAYQRNEFDKAKSFLSAVTGENAANAHKFLQQIDDYTKAANEGARLDSAGNYKQAIERYSRALKIKGNGPVDLKQKITAATEKLAQLKQADEQKQTQLTQANDQPLIDGITDFYNGRFQQADEKLSAFSGSGSKKALALFYLGASELSRYFLAGADDKSKDLYNHAIENFRAARQAASGFSPPQRYISQRILTVFDQSGS
jgi:tetratricopeptide (TPR) repeat protein